MRATRLAVAATERRRERGEERKSGSCLPYLASISHNYYTPQNHHNTARHTTGSQDTVGGATKIQKNGRSPTNKKKTTQNRIAFGGTKSGFEREYKKVQSLLGACFPGAASPWFDKTPPQSHSCNPSRFFCNLRLWTILGTPCMDKCLQPLYFGVILGPLRECF